MSGEDLRWCLVETYVGVRRGPTLVFVGILGGKPIDVFAEQAVDFPHSWLVGQHVEVLADDARVIAHRGACLRQPWRQFVHLARRLVDEGQQDVEGQAVLLQQTLAQGIQVVGEVAGEDGRQVQVAPLPGVGLHHSAGQDRGYLPEKACFFFRTTFHEDGYVGKIQQPALAESLQGVEHAVAICMPLPDVHRDASGRMYPESLLPACHHLRQELHQGVVLERGDVELCVGRHARQARGIVGLHGLGQRACRLLRAAIYLHHPEAFAVEGMGQVGGQVTRPDKYDRGVFYASFHNGFQFLVIS